MSPEKGFFFQPRIIRSPLGDFWGDEMGALAGAYPEEYLRAIARDGYNGVWVFLNLRETVPSALFPGRREPPAALRELVEKTARHGIRVYCCLMEPRALPPDDPFWEKNPDLRGQARTVFPPGSPPRPTRALCSSTPEVREFLEESAYNLFRLVPGLGGAFLITASEAHTHCYSHYPVRQRRYTEPEMARWREIPFTCRRCAERTPPEVAAETINLVGRGIRRAAPDAAVIAWTWSWYILERDPQRELIGRLDRDIILMSDFERGGRKKAAGRFFPVDEYSFSSIGPSKRFRGHARTARENGLRLMAKIQVGNTHEIASVPYIPVPFLLAGKMRRMREMGVAGYLGCWIFGGGVSPMTRLAGLMSAARPVSPGEAVGQVAREEFGDANARAACRAWRRFSEAWREYPLSIPFLYYGPINYATAYPLRLKMPEAPATAGWKPLPRGADDFLALGRNTSVWLDPFTGGEVIAAFEKLLAGWREGVEILDAAAAADRQNARLAREADLGRHIMLSVMSTINITRFYLLDERRRAARTGRAEEAARAEIAGIFRAELVNTRQDREIVARNPDFGYHAEAHAHLYTTCDLDHKLRVLEEELGQLECGP